MKIENKINEVSVIINKAQITAVHFDIRDPKDIDIAVDIDLLSTTGKKVTSVRMGTHTYNDNTKIDKNDIPISLYHMLGLAVNELTGPVVRKINSIDKLLTAPVDAEVL